MINYRLITDQLCDREVVLIAESYKHAGRPGEGLAQATSAIGRH